MLKMAEKLSGKSPADTLDSGYLPDGQVSSDKGPEPETGSAPFSLERLLRVGWYVDGFNLYHAIDALKEPTLKWLDLRSLASSYLRPGHELTSVAFFTALNTWDAAKRARHVNYVEALRATGVEVNTSRFDTVTKRCDLGQRSCKFRQEKQSDVGLATRALTDAYDAGIDTFFFLTADSDQVPAVQAIRARFPERRIFLVAPPRRLKEARELGQACHHVFELTAGRLRQHLLPPSVLDRGGRHLVSRPSAYQPHTKA